MNTAITLIQVLLALLFVFSGLLKLTLPYAKFVKLPAQSWANDFKPEAVRLIGIFELCAAVGMIIPLLLHTLPMLTPLAGVGMAMIMSGAVATHLRRTEYPNVIGNLVWLGLALLVAYGSLIGFTA